MHKCQMQKSKVDVQEQKFRILTRCGFLAGDSKEISPIFTQFIDTTWQLMNQFPHAFQFNEK